MHHKKNVIIGSLIVFLFPVATLFAAPPPPASAQSSEEIIRNLQAQIELLKAQISVLKEELKTTQQQAAATQKETAAVKEEVASAKQEIAEVKHELQLTRSLQRGAKGDDVRKLQEFLAEKFSDLYPEGLITGFFGPATEAAIKKLQAQHGIEQVGFIGPKTLFKINELILEGAGESGKIPQGLLRAPGIQKKLNETTTPISAMTAPATPATTTPAIPAQPIGQTGTTTIPAIPAIATGQATTTVPVPTPVPTLTPPSPPSTATTTPAPTPAPTADTTVPVISNIQATTITAISAVITWTTNEPATSQVIYDPTTSYFSSTAIDFNLVTSHRVTLTGLTPSTLYHYAVNSQDAANNRATSGDHTFTTTLPGPTNIQAVTNSSGQEQPPVIRYYMTFNYTLQSATQSFNVYRKRPTDASFVKYTYSAQTPVNASILPLPGSGESNLYHRGANQWEWWTTLPAPVPDTAQGEYKFYVTAVDTSGVESVSTETKSFKLYPAPVITSPADGSTISSPFTIAVSGDPSASGYGMTIYKKITGDAAWLAWPAQSTNFTYNGSVLNTSDNPHRLLVWFSSGPYDRSLFGTSVFNIATTTSFLDVRAKNLAAIQESLNRIRAAIEALGSVEVEPR